MENTANKNLADLYKDVKHPETGEKMRCTIVNKQSDFESALRYKAKTNDVFICSHPKCGSTWLQNIVWLIDHHGEPIPSTKNLRECVRQLEFDGCEVTESTIDGKYPHIIKTHFPYRFVPQHDQAKYVYIARNPKDVVVSFYFHTTAYTDEYGVKTDINEFFNLYVKGKVEFGDYFDHVIEWYIKRDQPNVLFLLYEDLKTNTRSEVLKIARFLGDDYEASLLKNNEEILQKVLDQSSFKSMQENEHIFATPGFSSKAKFFRKGQIGDWKNHLSSEQIATVDRLLNEKGKESRVNLLWRNYPQV